LTLTKRQDSFCGRHNIVADTHTYTNIHPYEYMHAHSIPVNTSKRLK
jgi:hypothetical protein